MHDLKTICTKVFKTVKSAAKDYFVYGENHCYYPNPPRMHDLSIISLAITAECLEIVSRQMKVDHLGPSV